MKASPRAKTVPPGGGRKTNRFSRSTSRTAARGKRTASTSPGFGPDIRETQWDYFSFDPQETRPKETGARYREVTYPKGMENWFATDFDPAKSGWKKGLPPFGSLDGKLEPLGACDYEGSGCGCGVTPRRKHVEIRAHVHEWADNS